MTGQHSTSGPDGGFDSWPVWTQHLVAAVAPPILAYLTHEVVPSLPVQWAMAAGLVVTGLTAWLTPLVRAYGVGSKEPDRGAPMPTEAPPPGGNSSTSEQEGHLDGSDPGEVRPGGPTD